MGASRTPHRGEDMSVARRSAPATCRSAPGQGRTSRRRTGPQLSDRLHLPLERWADGGACSYFEAMHALVTDNELQQRFELPLAEGAVASLYYQVDDLGRLILLHTEVPFEFSGQGYATRLAQGALDLIRNSHRKAFFRCPFLSSFLRSHPGYNDLVAG